MAEGRALLACNAAAQALGVRADMPRAAALALAPALRVRERDPALEQATLEDAATWAGRYTPRVSIVTAPRVSIVTAPRASITQTAHAGGLLLEVAGSLKLFGGAAAILRGLRAGAAQLGLAADAACAPTAQGAWLLARAPADEAPCLDAGDLAQRLRALPLQALECDTAALAAVGLRTLGELLDLPRDSLARRYGPALCAELDRALGAQPDPRVFHAAPERFHAGLELPAEVEHAQALLFAARRLIAQLEGFLAARGGGAQGLRFTLFHRDAQTDIDIGLVRPVQDAERFALLAREKFSALALRAPVRKIALAVDAILPLAPASGDLLADELKPAGDWAQLAERLRARLGEQQVGGLAAHADHRPETAWRSAPVGGSGRKPGAKPTAGPHDPRGQRPMWLLEQPRRLQESSDAPCYAGRLELMAGPERIEVGWWDGREAARDYFIARNPAGALLWIYSERYRNDAGWYLHGIFG